MLSQLEQTETKLEEWYNLRSVPQKCDSFVFHGSPRVLIHISGTVVTENDHVVVWRPMVLPTVLTMVSPSPTVDEDKVLVLYYCPDKLVPMAKAVLCLTGIGESYSL